jgi:nucleoid-associated protein YgaU
VIGRRSALFVVAVSSAAAGRGLAALGEVVPGPPARLPALAPWYEAVGPAGAVAGGARWLGVGLAIWVSVASILQLLTSATRLISLQTLVDLLSPRSLQRVGYGLAGLSLTAGLAAPAPGAGTPSLLAPASVPHQDLGSDGPAIAGTGTATMHRVEPSATTPDMESTSTEQATSSTAPSPPPIVAPSTTADPVVPTTTSVPPSDAPRPSGGAGSAPAAPTPTLAAPDALPAAEPAIPVAMTGAPSTAPGDSGSRVGADTVVVRPGDSLWSIAEEALLDLNGQAEDRDVVRYWRRVVEANRSALTDPANPDLIFAGQVIALPVP